MVFYKRFHKLGGVALGVMKGHSAFHLSRSAWVGNKGMKNWNGKAWDSEQRFCGVPFTHIWFSCQDGDCKETESSVAGTGGEEGERTGRTAP